MMNSHRWHHLIVILLVLVSESLGFTARLQTPWEKTYSPLSSPRRLTDKQSSSRESALSAKDDDTPSSKDNEGGKSKEEEPPKSSYPLKPRVFVASSTGSQDTVYNDDAPLTMINGSPMEPAPTVRSCLRPLLESCRPSNFLGVTLFHILGAYLSLQQDPSLLWSTLVKPPMLIALLVLLGVSSTSMVINDYYDTKSGVDANKIHKPLVEGHVPLHVARAFLNYLYAILLLGVAVMPGVATRISAMAALILTYWYTKHLKPITWIKNFVCAAIMSFAPITSASAALQVATGSSANLFHQEELWRLVAVLFAGFMGREVMMDCNDVVDDRSHRIRTVPVKYGRRFASRVGLFFTIVAAGLAVAGPLLEHNTRRLVLAGMGGAMMVIRGLQVCRTDGEDEDVVDKFVIEGKLTVMLILASFV